MGRGESENGSTDTGTGGTGCKVHTRYTQYHRSCLWMCSSQKLPMSLANSQRPKSHDNSAKTITLPSPDPRQLRELLHSTVTNIKRDMQLLVSGLIL